MNTYRFEIQVTRTSSRSAVIEVEVEATDLVLAIKQAQEQADEQICDIDFFEHREDIESVSYQTVPLKGELIA